MKMKQAGMEQIRMKTEAGTARFVWKTINGAKWGLLARESWNASYFSADGGKSWFKSAKEAVAKAIA